RAGRGAGDPGPRALHAVRAPRRLLRSLGALARARGLLLPSARRLARVGRRAPRQDREAGGMSESLYQLKSDPYSSHAVILSRMGDGRGRRALDVGAADGFLAELLTRQGWQVTALERDSTQAAKARGRCHEVIVA